jgi:transmembrane sensor
MEEDYYIALIARSISKETSQVEEAELSAWIKLSPDNENVYLEYKNIWEAAEEDLEFEPNVEIAFEKFEKEIDALQEPKVIKLPSVGIKNNWKMISGIAASLILVIGIAMFFRSNATEQISDVLILSKDKMIEKSLPDGSIISMNKGSKISFNSTFEKREVEFSGEAFFSIQKDPVHPFEIHCDVSTIKVLGTSFNVKHDSIENTVTVTVATGVVELSTANSEVKETITKNEKAIIHLKSGEISLKTDEKFHAMSWKENKLTFENETMENIADAISNHFNIKFEISEEIKKCRFTAEFKHPQLEEIISLFENYYKISKFSHEDGFQIKGTKCD